MGDAATIAARLGFSAEELALNRVGRVSPAQLARLQRDRKRGRLFLVFVLLFLVAFAVVVATVVIPQVKDANTKSSSTPVVPIVIGVLVLVALLITFSVLRTRRSLDRIASGRVLQVTGPARGRARRMHGNVADPSAPGTGINGAMRYELTIGDVRFFVAGQPVLDAFADGAVYRGYYVAGGNRVMNLLLSAEPLGPDPR